MKLGKLKLELIQPEGLDDALIALTGCNAAEVREQLRTTHMASHMAAALLPFLKHPMHRHQLAAQIAAAGIEEVRPLILKLYEERSFSGKQRKGS